MASIKFCVLLLAFAGICFADSNNEDFLPRLVGGVNTLSGEFPSLVSIRGPVLAHCNGVIVNDRHVLTSAQCVLNGTNQAVNPFFFTVISGDLNMMVPTYRRFTTNVTHIYTHVNYVPNTRLNDIAVIRVGNPFPFPHNTIDVAIRTIRVMPEQTVCRFAGWGSPTAGGAGALNAVQQAFNAPILTHAACNAITVHAGRVLESMICAGSIPLTAPPSGPCYGNLGGGLFCQNELVGILAYGLGCGLANQPGVYTQVRFHMNWINAQFTRTDATFP